MGCKLHLTRPNPTIPAGGRRPRPRKACCPSAFILEHLHRSCEPNRVGVGRRAGGGPDVAVPPLAGSARVTHDTHAHSLLHALHDRCTRPRMTLLDDHLHSRSRRRLPPAPRLYSLGHSLRHYTLHANRISTARCELIRKNLYTCGSIHFRA